MSVYLTFFFNLLIIGEIYRVFFLMIKLKGSFIELIIA